jgi:hypothetical protein
MQGEGRMESTLRKEVQDFTRACQTLAGLADQHNGLTDEERDVVVNFARELEQEVSPHLLQYYQGAPLATRLSNVSLFD